MEISAEMARIVQCMNDAVDELLERNAKLGYKMVVRGKGGKPKVLSAKYLLRKRNAERRLEQEKHSSR